MKKFPPQSRVVFVGDSITAANLTLPRIIDAYKTNFPDENIRFFNCGVAGGTVEFALKSFEYDILRHKPTHAVIAFGINDSMRDYLAENRSEARLSLLNSAYETYCENLRALVDRFMALGVEVVLCTPVPYDEYTDSPDPALRGGYALMLGYAEYVRNLAREKGVTLYDQHKMISRLLAVDRIIGNDHIHPTPHGYFEMARLFLAEQGIELGAESPLPEYFSNWHSRVARLRKVLAAECMLIPDDTMTDEEKIDYMQVKLDNKDWKNPVFESFIRDYIKDKRNQSSLYDEIDSFYEKDIV